MAGKTKKGPGQAETEVYAHDAPSGEKLPATCWGENSKANARLIAAAPDMLAALERIQAEGYVHDYHPKCNSYADACMLRDAIAKARGPQ